MKKSLELLEQILDLAKVQAKDLNDYNIKRHKALLTIGTNPVVFHLELLKELILEESGQNDKNKDNVQVGEKNLNMAYGGAPWG